MKIVSITPGLAVFGTFPLEEDVEVGEMITFGDAEVGMDVICFFFFFGRAIKDLSHD